MKETLQAIRRTTPITTHDLARQANLPVADVMAVEVGGYTSQSKAQRVVRAFNRLSGMHIEVEDIRIHCQENTL